MSLNKKQELARIDNKGSKYPKILIIGASGFLGTKLYNILKKRYNIYGTYFSRKQKNLIKFDITNKQVIELILNKINPAIIINCSALSNVDACELNKEKAGLINTKGVSYLIQQLNKRNEKIKLIHLSTDFVFGGNKRNYKEKDMLCPVNCYGKTKLAAEKEIINNYNNYLILRSAALYGYNGNKSEWGFVDWVYNNLKNNKKIKVATERIATPTLINDIANAIMVLIEKNKNGIYHAAGSESISRYDMALQLAQEFGFNRELIKPCKEKDLKLQAKRLKNSSLNISKLEKEGIFMHNFSEGLKIMKEQMGI